MMAKQENAAPSSTGGSVNGLEMWLASVYQNAPSLPVGARTWIASNAYWLAAIGGVLGLWSAYSLWRLAQWGSSWSQYAAEVSKQYGTPIAATDYGVMLWVMLAVTVVQSVLLLMAIGPLKSHRKGGWNLLFYSGLLSVAVAVLYLFTSGYGVSNFLSSLLGAAIGFYFLFQIRDHFKV